MDTSGCIIPFESAEFGTVRALLRDGEPWFVAKDVMVSLGLTNTTEAMRKLDEDEFSSAEVIDSMGRMQETRIVSEAGLYALVLSSRKPEARAFKRWVTHEVLPSIRRHGVYATPDTVESLLGDPDFAIRAFTALRGARARAESLERENATLRPRAALAETALDLEGDQSLTKASRYLRQVDPRMTRNRLVALLRGDGMLCQRDLSPTREAIDRGYLVQKMPRYEGSDGSMRMGSPYAHVTAKGLDWMARRYCVVAPLRLVEGVA